MTDHTPGWYQVGNGKHQRYVDGDGYTEQFRPTHGRPNGAPYLTEDGIAWEATCRKALRNQGRRERFKSRGISLPTPEGLSLYLALAIWILGIFVILAGVLFGLVFGLVLVGLLPTSKPFLPADPCAQLSADQDTRLCINEKLGTATDSQSLALVEQLSQINGTISDVSVLVDNRAELLVRS